MVLKDKFYSKIIPFLLIIGSILIIYGWGMWDLYRLITIFGIIYCFFFVSSSPFFFPKPLLFFAIYFVVISLFLNGIASFPFGQLMFIFFFAFYVKLFKQLDIHSVVKVYRVIAITNIFVVLLQTCGFPISGIVPILPVSESYYEAGFDYLDHRSQVERFCGFFAEPAHFIQFLLPLVCLELFYYKKNLFSINMLLYLVGIVLMRSGNGFIGLMVVMIYYVIQSYKAKGRQNFFSILSILIMAIIAIALILKSNYGIILLERTSELSKDQTEITSGYIRIWYGYTIYDTFDIVNKFIGGSESMISTAFTQDGLLKVAYFNTVQSVLLRTGIIGVLLFFYMCAWFYKNALPAGRAIVLVFVILSFMSAMYFTHTMALYFSIITLTITCKKPIDNIVKRTSDLNNLTYDTYRSGQH